MKKSIVFLAAIALAGFIGCSTPQEPVPSAPAIKSEAGKACVRECQTIFAQCTAPCGKIFDSLNQKTCLNNCNTVLKDCYATCE